MFNFDTKTLQAEDKKLSQKHKGFVTGNKESSQILFIMTFFTSRTATPIQGMLNAPTTD